MRSLHRNSKKFHIHNPLASFIAGRAKDGLGCRLAELAAICGGHASARRAVNDLTDRGWRVRCKAHAGGDWFYWAESAPDGTIFATRHFHPEPSQFDRPLLAAPPAPSREEALR